ncbi:ATP-binding protein [Phenylobacterium sp.]|uniref:ATP-binding protein n=1 Tax=Phenylobacterium sp. TaxID=1871053 RepID=UPI0027321B65|nr:ATP-binding protein [Phenylobacterium sp.]MDP2214035.1 ATP-binding protein [Phenylobacterium sp.]
MARDYIMSFIVRPGRVVSPAAVGEIESGRIGADIEPASDQEAEEFIEASVLAAKTPVTGIDGPVGQTKVASLLRLNLGDGGLFSGTEQRYLEYKSQLPADREARAKISKTMAAMANTVGGYIIFGIGVRGQIIGIPDDTSFGTVCDDLEDFLSHHFCPAITWDRNVIRFRGRRMGVIFVHESMTKPVITMQDSVAGLTKSAIYFRYEGKSQRIEPGDLIAMLASLRGRAE